MKRSFGRTSGGREAGLYIIKNDRGMEAAVTDYGASLVKLLVRDREGVPRDLVLGYDDVRGYEQGEESMGGTVGRVANRIGAGRFRLGGRDYQLTVNSGPNTLHGGRDFYVHRLWESRQESDSSVSFALDSPDGDQGFPGFLRVIVTYALTPDNTLLITYRARCDSDTPVNLTNHSYFNLAGHDSGSVLSQRVMVEADRITETDAFSLPTGSFLELEGTPMDFREEKALGKDIDLDYQPLLYGNGYDHNYIIRGEGYRQAARIYCPETGIEMTVSTDLPGLQLYTANYLNHEPGKGGACYQARDAVCFETQFYPDSVNKPHFPGGILRAGENYFSRTGYRFSLRTGR